MRLIVIASLLLMMGCNQVSGASDFTFEEESSEEKDAGDAGN